MYNNGMKKKLGNYLRWALHVLLYVFTLALIAIWLRGGRRTEALLPYLSGQPFFAGAALLCLYGVKSQAFLLPFSVLYALAGLLFPPPLAMALNIGGVAITVSIPFLQARRHPPAKAVRRLAGAYPKIQDVYPKLAELQHICQENDLFFSYFARVVSILPGRTVSRALGALGVAYPSYLVGSLLGYLPHIVAITMLGSNIMNPRSPLFLWACLGTVLIAGCSAALYWAYRRLKGKREVI